MKSPIAKAVAFLGVAIGVLYAAGLAGDHGHRPSSTLAILAAAAGVGLIMLFRSISRRARGAA